MASNYWAKMWIEMIDDRKTATLPDSSWRRFVECILLAKELNEGGYLPPVIDMAFRLRLNEQALADDLTRLALAGLLELREGDRWFITNFGKRQSKMSDAERVSRHRDATKKKQYSNDTVTKRYTETETEAEKEGESASQASHKTVTTSPSPELVAIADISNAITDVTGISAKLNKQKMYELSEDLYKAGYTPEQIRAHYGHEKQGGAWNWYEQDWRGKKGEKPKLNGIRETIAGAVVEQGEAVTVDGDSIWRKAMNAIRAGAPPQDDPRLLAAIKAVGWPVLQSANDYNAKELKGRLSHAYQSAA